MHLRRWIGRTWSLVSAITVLLAGACTSETPNFCSYKQPGCVAGYTCDFDTCVPKPDQAISDLGGDGGADQGKGGACSGPHQCASGFCVDGVCCDDACAGACQECSSGTCAVRPKGACPDTTLTPSCSTNVTPHVLDRWVCDGVKTACITEEELCGFYACAASGDACRDSCTLPSHCTTGFCFNADGSCRDCWAKGFGSTGKDVVSDVVLDAQGNTIVTGTFVGTVTFGTKALTATSSTGDLFVLKLDPKGAVSWVVHGRGGVQKLQLGVSGSGDVVVVGLIHGQTLRFGPTTLTASVDGQVFVLRLTSSGTHSWVKAFHDISPVVAVDTSGNAYLAGTYTGTISVGGKQATSTSPYDLFVAKLDHSGNVVWLTSRAGAYDGGVNAIAVSNSGQVAVVSETEGPTAIDAALSTFKPSGTKDWEVNLTNANEKYLYDVAFGAGGIYVVGHFQTAVKLGPSITLTPGAGSAEEGFVAQFSTTGTALAAVQTVGNGGTIYLSHVAATPSGVVVGGFLEPGNATFGGKPLVGTGAWIAALDLSNQVQWAIPLQSGVGLQAIAANDTELRVVGSFDKQTSFCTSVLPVAGDKDAFVWGL